jgi:hypothetical protein
VEQERPAVCSTKKESPIATFQPIVTVWSVFPVTLAIRRRSPPERTDHTVISLKLRFWISTRICDSALDAPLGAGPSKGLWASRAPEPHAEVARRITASAKDVRTGRLGCSFIRLVFTLVV